MILGSFLLIGAAAGLLAGLLGVGGGIIIVPAFRFMAPLLGLPDSIMMHSAVATSVALIVPTSFISARSHYKRGAVDLGVIRLWGPALAAGSLLAGSIANHISSQGLAILFSTIALIVGAHMAAGQPIKLNNGAFPQASIQAALSCMIGMISSWMGIGGGTFSVPLLSAFGLPIHRAVGTGAALGLCISLPGLLGWLWSGWNVHTSTTPSLGYIQLIPFALMLIPMITLAPVGAKLAHALPAAKLKRTFGCFLMATAGALAFKAFF